MPHLDGLRAVAVLLVIAAHFPYIASSGLSHAFWRVVQAGRTGYIGVDLFFILSGFLITRILLKERNESGAISFSGFYIKRVFRIFPIYYLCVLAVAVFFPAQEDSIPSLVFYTFNYYHPLHPTPHPMEHTWSLAVEEQFYIIWPFVIALVPFRLGRSVTGMMIPALAMLAAVIFTLSLKPDLAGMLIYQSLPTRMLSLSLGAYIAFREADDSRLTAVTCLALAAAGIALLGGDQLGRAVGLIPAGGWYWCGALAGYGMLGFGIITYLTLGSPPAWLRAGLSAPTLRYIGRISYGLYLYHLIVLYALGLNQARLTDGSAPLFSVLEALALTFAIAALSYTFIEKPMMRLRNRVRPVASAT